MERVFYLRDHPKPAKHVSFDYSTSSPSLTVSGSDGMIYVYSLAEEQPELVKKIDGLIRSLETEDESSSRVVWHPDGRAFATATGTRGNVRMLLHLGVADITNRCPGNVQARLGEATCFSRWPLQ